jgi:hypothetical protein
VDTRICINNKVLPMEAFALNKVNIFIGLLLIVVLALLPAYILPSGGFQAVDFPLAIIIAVIFFTSAKYQQNLNQIFYLIPFVIWAILINLGYFILNNDISYLFSLAAVLYAPFIIYTFTAIYSRMLRNYQLFYIYLGLILSIIVTLTIKGVSEEEGRAILSFNDPNQLGYFAIIILCYAILLIRYKEITQVNKMVYYCFDGLIILFAHYFLALSMSRSAMAGMFVLDICLLKNIRSSKMIVPVILFIVISSLSIALISPQFIQDRLATRSSESYSEEELAGNFRNRTLRPLSQLEGLQILFGRGQGGFGSKAKAFLGKAKDHGGESHNIFGEALRGYGLIGLLLLLFWLGQAIWAGRILKDSIWIWGGLLLFNMGNYGLRWRAFWILLGLLFAMVSLVEMKKNQPTTETPFSPPLGP